MADEIPLSPADYFRQQQEAADRAVRVAAMIASQPLDKTPDEYAQAAKLAKSVNLPTAVIEPNYKTFAQRMTEKRNELVLSGAPILTDWIQKDDNHKVAADDLEPLSWWESLAIVPRGIASAIPAVGEGTYGALAALSGLPGKNSVSDWFAAAAHRARKDTETIAGPSGNWVGQMTQGASQSVGMMAPGIIASIASGGAASPGIAAAYIAPGALTQGGQSAIKALDQGKSAGQALQYGALDAAAEAIFEKMPVGKLLKDIGAGTGFGKLLAGQIAREVPSEVATTLYQNLNEYSTLTPNKPFGEFLAEQPAAIRDTIAQTVLATVGVSAGGRGVSKILERAAKDQGRAQVAEGNQQVIGDISTNAQGSALRTRLPGKFGEYLDSALADGPVENIYVPGQQFAEYFQSQGHDPHEVIDALPGVSRDDLDVALAGGGDLKIPTSTYAAHIAGGEADPFFMENMRFSPDEMTGREAAEFNARSADVMQEAWAEAERIRTQDEALRGAEERIYTEMQSRLRQAGRTTDVANSEATLYPAFYRVMAERSGMTTEQFLEKYPLPQVEGARPEGMQTKDVGAFNRALAEARSRKEPAADKRQTLLEFIHERGGINDPGGELRARDAQVVKRGKGKKNLRLARDTSGDGQGSMLGGETGGVSYSVDDVARAAIDAGFMADNPDVLAYKHAMESGGQVPDVVPAMWDAIDRELRGEPQRAGEADQAAIDREASLDDLEQYLNSIGVSLGDSDADILGAVKQDEEARRYAQGKPRLLFHNTGGGPRGSISFSDAGLGNGDTIIRLSERADLSTLLHESGHYFLTVMQDMAATDPAVAGEFGAVKEWWGQNAAAVAKDARKAFPELEISAEDVQAAIDNGTSGDEAKDRAIDVGMQEQWARSFEQYVMEGKAPSAELRGAFERFRAWLLSIYRKLSGLNVNVSDDLRRVFDRMLASDQEIENAQAESGGEAPLFASAEQMGLTDEEFDRFQKLRGASEDEAKAKLLAETMAPIRREREKWFKEERAQVKESVTGEVNAYRQYRALEWMGNRRWFGEGQPEAMPDMRLSKGVLVERYGEGVLKTLPRGKQTVYTVEGGLDPDDAAGWFGFDSGDEMIKALEQAPPRKEAIEAETNKRMRETHGDVLRDGSVEEQALDAVHNDKRGEWLAAELKAVTEVAGSDKDLTAKQAREIARQTMARMKVRDAMASNRFLAAERKAGQEAQKLAGMLGREGVWMGNARRRIATKARAAMRDDSTFDAVAGQIDQANKSTGNYNETVAALIDAKRRQLLNHALYSESRKVGEEVAKAERFVAGLNKASKREKIAGAGRRENAQIDYLGAIDELLDRYDFRKLSGKAEDRRGKLNDFVQAMTEAGRANELAIPEKVLADSQRAPYKTLPVEELRGVIDSLKNLEHVSLRWNELIDAKNKRDFDEAADGIAAQIDHNLPHRPAGRVATKGENAANSARAYLNTVLNATTLLREIDGFKDQGAAYENIKAPIDDAQNRLIVRKQQAAEALEKLYGVYSKQERRAMGVRHHIPELGTSLSKWEMIALALNTGNEGNLARLMSSRAKGSFSEEQIKAVLGRLDARDAQFVQSVWDYVASFQPDMAARERRTTGTEPNWVEPTPVEIGGKMLKGGYYPIKYDPRISPEAADRQTVDLAEALMSGRFGKAQTKNGHLQARAEGGNGGSINLDMSVLHKHVNEVIHDLEMSEPLSNAWRLLQDRRVRGGLENAGRSADFDALQGWIKDIADGDIGASSKVGAIATGLKSNFTAAKLAFNLSNALLQISGVAQSFVVVGKKDMARGIAKTVANPKAASEAVAAKSPFMAQRQTTFNKDVMDFYTDPKAGTGATRMQEFKRNVWGPVSFWLMQKMQWHFADVPTWIAGYEQGLRRFDGNEEKAVQHADRLVKRAQASGLFIDRTGVERGTLSPTHRQNEFIKLFSTLGSYMFAKFNAAYERSAVAAGNIKKEGVSAAAAKEAISWTVDMMLLFTLEALVGAAVKGGLPGGDDDEDNGWMKWLAKNTGLSVLGTLPFIRDGASVLQGHDGGGAYGSIVSDAFKGAASTAKIGSALFGDDEVKISDIKNVINGTGVATGLPTVAINRIVDAGWRQSEGEDVPPLEYLFGKPPKK